METLTYDHFPASLSTAHVALFVGVSNAKALRARIVAAATREGPEGDAERQAVNFAFVDARLVTSVLHLRTAIQQAILAETQGALRTRTVHSEVLWALNPSNNITEAIRRYGVSDGSTALFVVRVAPPGVDDIEARMRAVVSGSLSGVGALSGLTDWGAVKKYHKLNGEPAIASAGKDGERERAVVDNIVVSSVAMKSVMA
ncbi:CGI-121-domain-containing protein [Amylostereum chailletii]|nr:CGI-121-domain-containing protein [Amylostereum chailletii]